MKVTRVWVILRDIGEYSVDFVVDGVFGSKDKAEERIKQLREIWHYGEFYLKIEEYEIQ